MDGLARGIRQDHLDGQDRFQAFLLHYRAMRTLTRHADSTSTDNAAARLRRERFRLFRAFADELPRPVRILDAGGTQSFWEVMGYADEGDVHITLMNLKPDEATHPNFEYIAGDVRDLSRFEDDAFDLVFSNSVIEHVGTFADQQQMAREVRRVGRRYFVQTPNRYFPIEPHFLFPGYQFLPLGAKAWLLRHFRLGWYPKIGDREEARRIAAQIRLLTRREFRQLFPEGEIHVERWKGLAKSFIVMGVSAG